MIFVQNIYAISLSNKTIVTSVHGLAGPRWESTVSGNNLYVGWLIGNDSNDSNPSKDLFLKRFASDEQSNITLLKVAHGDLKDFRIAAIANKVFIIWSDQTHGKEGIYLKRSLDNGISFGAPIALVKGLHTMVPRTATGVSVSGSNLYIAYHNVTDNKLWVLSSHDNADSFKSTNIPNTTNTEIVGMAAEGRFAYVMLSENLNGPNLFFTRSANSGNSFENVRKLSDNIGSSGQMEVFNNHIYIVAFNRLGQTISFLMSDNNGINFRTSNVINNLWVPPIQNIPNGTTLLLRNTLLSNPEMVAFGNNVYVIWSSRSILYIIDRNSTFPHFVSSGEYVNEAFSSNSGYFFNTIPINLRQYFTSINFNNEAPFPVYAKISAFGNNTLAVWRDATSSENTDLLLIEGSKYEGDDPDEIGSSPHFNALPFVISNKSDSSPFNWKIESSDRGTAYVIWDEAAPFERQGQARTVDLSFVKIY